MADRDTRKSATDRGHEAYSDDAAAIRVTGVLKDGVAIDSTNPLPVDAGLSEDAVVGLNPRPGRFLIQSPENGGSRDLNVDGSTTPVDFLLSPATGKKVVVKTLVLVFVDTAIDFSKFGGIAAITNGLEIFTKEGGESERQINDALLDNADFYGLATDILLQSTPGSDILKIELDLSAKLGTQFELTATRGDYVKITVNDDLSGLNEFYAIIFGYEVDE